MVTFSRGNNAALPFRKNKFIFSILISGLLASSSALAADYPERPINLIVPYTAGGDADMSARTLAKELDEKIPKPIVVQNKGGAGGLIGSSFVHKSEADGYTLLLARVGSQAILPALLKNKQYEWDEFTFLGVLDINPMVCVVNQKSPFTSLDSLIDHMKANPGALSYSTTGPATSLNLAAQTLFSSADLPKDIATEIPYKGGGEATAAVLAQDVDFSCNNMASLLSNITGGRLRALVTTSPNRLKQLPDVPTAAELGHPKLEGVNGWSALYGPAGLPNNVVAYWEENLQYLMDSESWKAALEAAGSIPRVLIDVDAANFIEGQYNFYSDLGSSLGLEID